MVSAVKWEGEPSGTKVIDLGSTLAADTLSSFDSTNKYDNGSNLNTLAWFVLETSDATDVYASAVTRAGASLDLYLARVFDGTNLENVPVTADRAEFPHLLIASIPIPTEIGARPMGVGPVLLPPFEFQMAAYNNTDQQMTAEWEISLYPTNYEGQ